MIIVASMIVMIAVVIMIVVVVMTCMIIVIVMVIIVVIMIVMTCMVVVIIVAGMFIMVMNMDLSVKVFRFTPNQRRSYRSLNRNAATGLQAPLEDTTKQSIKGVMPWGVVKVGFKPPMGLNCDHRSELKLTGLRCISTSPMVAVGEGWPSLNQRQKQQSKKKSTFTRHRKRDEKFGKDTREKMEKY
jgi:hypothetical protein